MLSIVVPCFNEEEVLPYYRKEIEKTLSALKIDYEIIFVDDGSKDGTLALLRQYALSDSRLKYISFSRNFGKEAGLYAGL